MQWGTTDDICRAFREYGAIEHIELHPEKYPVQKDGEENYALVTFADSRGAHQAVQAAKEATSDLIVILADTWKQPDYEPRLFLAEDAEISLNCLPDDCLMSIFEYISNTETLLGLCHVCNRFSAILQQRIFPLKFRKLSICFDEHYSASSWEIFEKAVPHATKVRLDFGYNQSIRNKTRLLDVFTRNLWEELERLDLFQVKLSGRLYEQLKPVLKRLKVFKLHELGGRSEFDFVHFCPKMKSICLVWDRIFDINADTWPLLESAKLILSSEDVLKIPRFIQNNPHLKRLKIDIADHFWILTCICTHLPNLETVKVIATRAGPT